MEWDLQNIHAGIIMTYLITLVQLDLFLYTFFIGEIKFSIGDGDEVRQ